MITESPGRTEVASRKRKFNFASLRKLTFEGESGGAELNPTIPDIPSLGTTSVGKYHRDVDAAFVRFIIKSGRFPAKFLHFLLSYSSLYLYGISHYCFLLTRVIILLTNPIFRP